MGVRRGSLSIWQGLQVKKKKERKRKRRRKLSLGYTRILEGQGSRANQLSVVILAVSGHAWRVVAAYKAALREAVLKTLFPNFSSC